MSGRLFPSGAQTRAVPVGEPTDPKPEPGAAVNGNEPQGESREVTAVAKPHP